MKNWAGNVEYSTQDVRHPTTPAEVAEIVAAVDAADGQLKALGSRHSFSLIADTAGTLVALDELVVEPTLQLGDDGAAGEIRSAPLYGAARPCHQLQDRDAEDTGAATQGRSGTRGPVRHPIVP